MGLISEFARQTVKKQFKAISEEERAALESGDSGFEEEIFSGKPNWENLFEPGPPTLSIKEKDFIQNQLKTLNNSFSEWDVNTSGKIPDQVFKYLQDNKFFGLVIPEKSGGLGFSALGHSEVVMNLGSHSSSPTFTVMVPNSLGPAELIGMYGTQKQKNDILPKLASGEDIPCFCLTEPHIGSDAANVHATGVVYKDEASGELKMRMNWEKRYITLAPTATLMGVAFQLKDPDGLLPEGSKPGVTLALVPTNTAGVSTGEKHRAMDMAFENGPTFGKDVCLPLDNIIGGPAMAGQGWKMLMEALSIGRSISLPSLSTAVTKKCALVAGGYSRARKQFDTQIGEFEMVKQGLGRIAGSAYMMDAVRTNVAQLVDKGTKPAVASAIAKYYLTDEMRSAVIDTYDILGGKAIMQGPKNPLGDAYKGIFIAPTVEGANLMTKGLIIFGQGSFRAHPQMRKMIEHATSVTANDNDLRVAKKEFKRALRGFILGTIGSLFRSVFYGLKGSKGGAVPKSANSETRVYFKQINKLSASFNLAANAAIATVGGSLKREELLSSRLGEAYANLLLASWTLKHFHDRGAKAEELPLVQWVVEDRLNKSETNLKELCRNFPKFAGMKIGSLMKPFVVWGEGKHRGPSDALTLKVGDILRSPGPLLDSITDGVHVSSDPNDPISQIVKASKMVVESESLEIKLKKGFSKEDRKSMTREQLLDSAVLNEALTQDEVKTLQATDAACLDVIVVDKFPPRQTPDVSPVVEKVKRKWGVPNFGWK